MTQISFHGYREGVVCCFDLCMCFPHISFKIFIPVVFVGVSWDGVEMDAKRIHHNQSVNIFAFKSHLDADFFRWISVAEATQTISAELSVSEINKDSCLLPHTD